MDLEAGISGPRDRDGERVNPHERSSLISYSLVGKWFTNQGKGGAGKMREDEEKKRQLAKSGTIRIQEATAMPAESGIIGVQKWKGHLGETGIIGVQEQTGHLGETGIIGVQELTGQFGETGIIGVQELTGHLGETGDDASTAEGMVMLRPIVHHKLAEKGQARERRKFRQHSPPLHHQLL
ncbi:hypothetical protein ACROYT_G014178 [Oculina patagonica]